MSDSKGVAFNPPPVQMIQDIHASIDKAVAAIPEGHRNAIVGIVTESGTNVAVVHQFDHGWTVTEWLAKDWGGSVTGGAMVRRSW